MKTIVQTLCFSFICLLKDGNCNLFSWSYWWIKYFCLSAAGESQNHIIIDSVHLTLIKLSKNYISSMGIVLLLRVSSCSKICVFFLPFFLRSLVMFVRATRQQLKIDSLQSQSAFTSISSLGYSLKYSILKVILPACSGSYRWLFPLYSYCSKARLWKLSWGFLLTWPNHLSWELSNRKSSVLMFRFSNFKATHFVK